jgi:hypothetical protein
LSLASSNVAACGVKAARIRSWCVSGMVPPNR